MQIPNWVLSFAVGFMLSQNFHCTKSAAADPPTVRATCAEFKGEHIGADQKTYTRLFGITDLHDPRLNFEWNLDNGSFTVTSDTLIFCNADDCELWVGCWPENGDFDECNGKLAENPIISNGGTIVEFTLPQDWITCFQNCQNFGFTLNYKQQ